jgi:hypothetical protein
MASNLTIESPNFDKIHKEAGAFTEDAISLLWFALNDTRAEQRRGIRIAQEQLAPKVIQIAPSASVNDLDLQGASVVEFTGASSVNLTGLRAPETGKTRIVIAYVSGAGTITLKHLVTSETQNQLYTVGGADSAKATGAGAVLVYLSSKWRQLF